MSKAPLLGDLSVERPDKICYEPSAEPDPEAQEYLIYFITGNPGLISYYQPFLSRLHSLLTSSSSTEAARFHICGHSLKGFEFSKDDENAKLPSQPFSLAQQIVFQEDLLYKHISSHRKRTGNNPKVILMGHSVGAYILLELIGHHGDKIDEGEQDFDLIGGVLLFPTITHIAKSPLGMIASKILNIPYLPVIMGILARSLSSLLPASLFHQLVKLVTKFPEYAAQPTTAFIKSPMGVRQALHLAKDEMDTITEDKWDTEIWGAATAEGTNNRDTINSNLTMYWGQKDKWVADHTRDALIKARGRRTYGPEMEPWKPVMLRDEEGMPHDFCTTYGTHYPLIVNRGSMLIVSEVNSNKVAEKVNIWVDGIIRNHRRAIS